MELRWSRLRAHPSYTTFDELRRAASSLGLWESERDDAEAVLRSGSPADYLRLLVEGRRTDEAWALANEEPDAASRAGVWEQLCAVRAETHPAETLPVYRDLVWSWLETAHRSNYQGAAELMKAMRAAARRAGDNDGYERFLDEVVEKNRRRPACMEIFARHGLLT